MTPNPETGGHTVNYSFDIDVKAPHEVTELTAQRIVNAVGRGTESGVVELIEKTNSAALTNLP